MRLNVILAVARNNAIGIKNRLPWKIKEELNVFKNKTMNSVLIMGYNTAVNVPYLEGREIIGITTKKDNIIINESKNEIKFFKNFEECLEYCKTLNKQIFVAGGNKLYKYVFENYEEDIYLHYSEIKKEYDGDTFFDKSSIKNFQIIKKTEYDEFNHYEMNFSKFGEIQYLDLIRRILKEGNLRNTRNSETISLFNSNLSFDLRNGFPLLTTKKMFTKGIIEELLFFIRGDIDSKILERKNINIWKGNTSREFLDNMGFRGRKEGVMGPMYGYQWRKYNSWYNEQFQGVEKGIDQLQNVIDLIKNDPMSRRILLTTYNPCQSEQGVLFPCHSLILQFYVEDNMLDMYCYNRSSDIGLGLPFNIASSSLLLMIIAKITNKTPRFFHLTLGDCHIYKNHILELEKQIERIPYKFPQIKLPEITDISKINDLTYKNFEIFDYNCYDKIQMKMVS